MQISLSIELDDSQRSRLESIAGTDRLCLREDYVGNAGIEPGFLNCAVVFGNVPAAWLPESTELRWMQFESVGFGEYRKLDWSALRQQIGCNPPSAKLRSGWCFPGVSAAWMPPSSLQGRIHGVPWHTPPGPISAQRGRRVTPQQITVTNLAGFFADPVSQSALAGILAHYRGVEQLLREDALFVNFGRGSVVDEQALSDALTSNAIGGAVIDVTVDEPLPDTHPFWTTPNTILTQHSGGGSDDELDRKIEVFANNLALFRAGKPLAGAVDFDRGY